MKLTFHLDIQMMESEVQVENDNGNEATYSVQITDFDLQQGWIEVEATREDGMHMSADAVGEAIADGAIDFDITMSYEGKA